MPVPLAFFHAKLVYKIELFRKQSSPEGKIKPNSFSEHCPTAKPQLVKYLKEIQYTIHAASEIINQMPHGAYSEILLGENAVSALLSFTKPLMQQKISCIPSKSIGNTLQFLIKLCRVRH